MNPLQVVAWSLSTLILAITVTFIWAAHYRPKVIVDAMWGDSVELWKSAWLLLALVGLIAIFWTGTNAMIGWIPNSIGSRSDDGDFQSIRQTIAGLSGFGLGYSTASMIAKYARCLLLH